MANLPFYGTAFNLTVQLFTSAGLITNPGTLTLKISKDYGDYADSHNAASTPTEEDSTYGQIKVALDTTDMTADHIDGYVIDNTSGCFAAPFHIDTIPLVRGLAGTALPDAAADAAGGLPISDAGGLDLDTYIKRLEAAWTAALAARIDENISAAKTLTPAYDAAKTAAQAGDEMDLVDAPNATALAALAAAIEAAIINDGDATAVLQAIADKIAGDWTAGDLSAVAIASAVKTAMEAAGTHLTLIKAVTDAQGGTGAGLTALGDARLANLDAAVSTRLATTGYTAPDNAGIAALPTLAEIEASTVLAMVDDLPGEPPAAADIASQVRVELATELARIDAAITSRLATTGYTAPPSAAAVSAAVWSAVSRTLTAFGFEVSATVDEEALAAAVVAAISEEGVVDEAALAAAVVTALGALTVTVQSPVASSGTITVYQGDDYVAAEGTSIAVTVAVAGCPSLTGATIRLKLAEATWEATACTSDGTDWTIAFEPDAAETAALSAGTQAYELEATLASGSVRTLSSGVCVVEADIPAVPAEE